MSEGKSELLRTAENRVREIFQAAGHDVSEAVGEHPGEVLFFAEDLRRAGRLRIHWVVWERCPEDLDAALDALDQKRTLLDADRALAVVAQDSLPEEYRHDLHSQRVNAFTLRRFAFEMLGVFDLLQRTATPPLDAPHHPDQFLARRGVTEHGETVSAVEYIESVLDQEGPWLFIVQGERRTGRSTLLAHVAYRRALRCLADPEQGVPLFALDALPYSLKSRLLENIQTLNFYVEQPDSRRAPRLLDLHLARRLLIILDNQHDGRGLPWGLDSVPRFRLSLLAPDPHEIHDWYREHLPVDVYGRLNAAWQRHADIMSLALHLTNLSPIRGAAIHALETISSPHAWLAYFVIHYTRNILTTGRVSFLNRRRSFEIELGSGALEDFALGGSRKLAELHKGVEGTPVAHWLEVEERDPFAGRFSNRLLRDYFLAHKIEAEVRAHGPEIFARYQFPQEYVLLFLAVIAPDVAAQATADRSAELRARIQEEVEHQLQLTLAHQLKRSVGALRTNVGRVRRALTNTIRAACGEDLERIEDELAFLSQLAEKTRRWHEVPEERVEDVFVLAAIEGVLSQLRDAHAEAAIIHHVAPDTLVRAGRRTLDEILYCLLENAFHAACDPAAAQPPRIEVHAVHEGPSVVRIEVLDSGPGVDPRDRERIFEPRVTTKKGGPGRPLGTGMGLAIARKYAHAIGGRVEIDSERPQTCFVLKLVAGGMNRG